MSDGEVKIHVSADADLKGLDDAKRKLDEVNRKSKDPNNGTPAPTRPSAAPKPKDPATAPAPASKPKDPATAPVVNPPRRGVSLLATEANPKPKREPQTFRKLTDEERSVNRERMAAEDAAAKSASPSGIRAEAIKNERDAARLAKERAAAERATTNELKSQQALRKAGIGRSPIRMSSLTSAGIGALAGDVLSSVIDQIGAEEGLINRRGATASRNTRQATILNSIRGTSAQVSSEAWAAEDNTAQLKRDRPQLETAQKFGTMQATMEGGAWGAGIGATIGSIVPGLGTAIGAVIGAGIGAASKGIPAYLQGRNRLKQSEQDQLQEEERGKNLSELAPKLFMEQEGKLQLDKLRGQSKRTMAGQREVFANEMSEEYLKVYRDIYNRTKGNDGIAQEMAGLTVENSLRDRQAQAGAGLVDAKSGGAAVAAAAQWGSKAFGISDILGPKLDALVSHVESGNRAIQMVNQAK